MSFIVKELTPQKKRADRFNVFTDDGFLMSLSSETIVREKLKEGSEISEEDAERLRLNDTYVFAKELAANYIGYSMRTRKQLEDYLTRHGIDDATVEKTADLMAGYGYIDDDAYAKELMRSYGAKLGKRALRSKMLEKGLGASTIEKAMGELSDDDERAAAKQLIEKLSEKYKDVPEPKKKQRIYGALSRKGFSYSVFRDLLNGDGDDY